MNIADYIVIYLALGAPLSVYSFLQNRDVETSRRIAWSIFTLLFWIPAAVRLARRSFTNAYSGITFVSDVDLDADDADLAELREDLKSRLVRLEREQKRYPGDLTEAIDRYVGLGIASQARVQQTGDLSIDLFRAAGRSDEKLAAICLMRRNQRRIERHHTKARRDFLDLFENAGTKDPVEANNAIQAAIKLAALLKDRKTANALEAIAARVTDEVWDPQGQQPILSNITTPVSR